MFQAKIVSELSDVERDVSNLGLTLAIAQKVAKGAAAGRASALDIDVAFTPGMLSHIHGNRHLRLALLPHGWRKGRFNNVESVINDDLGIQIVFQNVDLACDRSHSPQAISGKGAGSRQLVEAGLQGELWENPVNLPMNRNQAPTKIGITPVVWMFCVSNDDRRLRAELSKPNNFSGEQFEEFSHRLFLLDEDSGSETNVPVEKSPNDGDEGFDVEVNVVRK